MTAREAAKQRREADKKYALEHVLGDLRHEVRRRAEIVRRSRGVFGDAYRREISRLWKVALRAVEEEGAA